MILRQKDTISDEMLEKLKNKPVYKNYREMCQYLEVKEHTGKSKQLFLKELNKHCLIEKISGQRFEVLEVYDEPIEENPSFKLLIAENLCSLFLKHFEETGRTNLDITFKNLITNLCFVNEKYKEASFDPNSLNTILGLEENNPISIQFFEFVNSSTKYYIKAVVNKLVDLKLIKCYKRLWVLDITGNWRRATDIEIKVILESENKALEIIKKRYNNHSLEGISSLISFGFLPEYQKEYEFILAQEEIDFSKVSEFFEFTFIEYIEKYYLENKMPEDKFKELNKKFIEYIDKHTLKQFEKLSKLNHFGERSEMLNSKSNWKQAPFRETYIADRGKITEYVIEIKEGDENLYRELSDNFTKMQH